MTAPMPETMSPREKVAELIYDRLGMGSEDPSVEQVSADIVTALASGSGDHAELARLAEAATPGPWFRGHNEHGSPQGEMSVWPDAGMVGGVIAKCGWQAPWDGWFDQPARDAAFIAAANPATVLALIAEVAALRETNTEAERKLAEAVGLLRETIAEHSHLTDVEAFEELGNVAATELIAVRTLLSKEAERG